MKKILFIFLAAVMMVAPLPTFTPSADAAEIGITPALWAGQAGTVTGNGVNVRTGPGTSFASLGTVAFGTTVLHLGSFSSQPDGWWENVRITSGPLNGREGWIRGDFLGNWHTPPTQQAFIRPLATGQVTQNFHSGHQGMDLQNTSNFRSPVLAAASGTVVRARNNCTVENNGCNGGLGNDVVIRHTINGVTYYTLYAHLDVNSVSLHVGAWVNQGTQIGRTGRTGTVFSQGHVHFEIHRHTLGSRVDPRIYIHFPPQCLDNSCRW